MIMHGKVVTDNRNVLNCLGTLLSDSFHVSFIDSIHLYTYASPEGREKYNVQLAVRRADTMQRYLADNYPLLSSVPVSLFPQGENWDGLRALVSADTAFNPSGNTVSYSVKEEERRRCAMYHTRETRQQRAEPTRGNLSMGKNTTKAAIRDPGTACFQKSVSEVARQ